LDILYVVLLFPHLWIWSLKIYYSAFLIQAGGGILADVGDDNNNNQHLTQLGLHIYQGGIGTQEFFILIFLAITIKTHIEISRFHNHYREQNWRLVLFPLYSVLILITVSWLFHRPW
jgi:hypothetical protein